MFNNGKGALLQGIMMGVHIVDESREKAHMNNILLRVALGIVILAILSACGGGDATQEPTEVPPTTAPTEAVEETEAAAEPTDADGATEATEAASDENTESVPEGTTATVNFPNAHARSGPATSFESLGALSVGTTLPVIARTEGSDVWYLVTLENGEPGWLWGRVVNLNPRDAEVEIAATVPSPP